MICKRCGEEIQFHQLSEDHEGVCRDCVAVLDLDRHREKTYWCPRCGGPPPGSIDGYCTKCGSGLVVRYTV